MPQWTIIGKSALGLCVLACSGCCLWNKPTVPQYRAGTQGALGSTHLAVLSVKRLSEYSAELQPRFKMDSGDAALEAVLPDTARIQQSVRDALRAELGIALPTTSTTTTSTTRQFGDSQPRSRTTEKTVTAPGDVADLTAPAPPAERYDQLTTPTNFFDAGLELDPMLKYLAATALFQEVKLLNTYVNDAAIGPGYEAYIARLQVAVQPRRRYQPYDTQVTMSLFPVLSERPAKQRTEPPTDEQDDRVLARQEAHLTALSKSTDVDRGKTAEQPIKVLPLLVTDNLEAAIASRSSQRVREVSLAALAMLDGAGLSGGLSKAFEELNNVLSRDFNSLYTISRVSDNTVRIRLGAMQIGNESYAMATRTHNVTLLVLVPRDPEASDSSEVVARVVDVLARTVLIDAKSGSEIDAAADREFDEHATEAVARHGFTGTDVQRVVVAVRRNDLKAFNEALDPAQRQDRADADSAGDAKRSETQRVVAEAQDFRNSRALWTDLADLMSTQRYVQLGIDLPEPPRPAVDRTGTPLLVDDGENSTRLELCDGRDLQRVKDSLTVHLKVPQKEGSPLALATSGVTVAPDGRSLVATFPSLSARKLFEPKDGSEQPSVSVTWSPRRDQVAEFYSARARYAMGKATPPKPAITAVLDVTLLPADRDPLDLPVVLRYAEDATAKEIAFRLVDARITKTGVLALKEKNVEFVEDRWVVAKPGATFTSLVLNLGEFKSSKVVQIVLLHDKKPVGEPIKLEVERAKAPAPGG